MAHWKTEKAQFISVDYPLFLYFGFRYNIYFYEKDKGELIEFHWHHC